MEARTKWNSCRLAVHRDSGRVRWCVGQEKTWKSNLKKLTIFPIILLTIVLLSVLVTHLYFSRKDVKTVRDDNNSDLVGDARREKLEEESARVSVGTFLVEDKAEYKREKREWTIFRNEGVYKNRQQKKTPFDEPPEEISKDQLEKKLKIFNKQLEPAGGVNDKSASEDNEINWKKTGRANLESASEEETRWTKTGVKSAFEGSEASWTKIGGVKGVSHDGQKYWKKTGGINFKRVANLMKKHSDGTGNLKRNNSNGTSNSERNNSNGISNLKMNNSNGTSNLKMNSSNGTSNLKMNNSDSTRNLKKKNLKKIPTVKLKINNGNLYIDLFQSMHLHQRQKREAAFAHDEDFNSTELEKDYHSQLIEWKIPPKRSQKDQMFNSFRSKHKNTQTNTRHLQENFSDSRQKQKHNPELREEDADDGYPVEQKEDEIQREKLLVFRKTARDRKRNKYPRILRKSAVGEENSEDHFTLSKSSTEEDSEAISTNSNKTFSKINNEPAEEIEDYFSVNNSTELNEDAPISNISTDEIEDSEKCSNSTDESSNSDNSNEDSLSLDNSNEQSLKPNNSKEDSLNFDNPNENSSKFNNSNKDSLNSHINSSKSNNSNEDCLNVDNSNEHSSKFNNSNVESSNFDNSNENSTRMDSNENAVKCINTLTTLSSHASNSTKTSLPEESESTTECNNSTETSSPEESEPATKCNNSNELPNPNSTNHRNFWKNKHDSEEIRKTQANNMIKYMDTSTDPCEDFYQYACGNWHLYNPIPPDRSSFDTFEMLRESLDSVLRDLLEENVPDDPVRIDTRFLMVDPKDVKVREKRFIDSYDDFPESSRRGENYVGKEGNRRFWINRELRKKRESFAGDKMEERMKTLMDGGFLEEFRKEKKHGKTHWKAIPAEVKKEDDVFEDNGFVVKSDFPIRKTATVEVRKEDLIVTNPIFVLNEVTEETVRTSTFPPGEVRTADFPDESSEFFKDKVLLDLNEVTEDIAIRASRFLPGEGRQDGSDAEGSEFSKQKFPLVRKNINGSRFHASMEKANDLDFEILKDAVAAEKMRSFSIDDFLGKEKVPNDEDAGTSWKVVSEEVTSTLHPEDIRSKEAALVDSRFLEDDTSFRMHFGLYENYPETNKNDKSLNSPIPEVVTTTRIRITSWESSSEEAKTEDLVPNWFPKNIKLERSGLFCNDVRKMKHFLVGDCEKDDVSTGKNRQPFDFYKTEEEKCASLNSTDAVAADRKFSSENLGLGQDFVRIANSQGIHAVQLYAISFPIKRNLDHEFPMKANLQSLHSIHNYEFQNEDPLLIKEHLDAVQDFGYSMKENLRNFKDYDFLLPEEKLPLSMKTNFKDNVKVVDYDFPMYPVRNHISKQRKKRHIHNDFYVTTFTRLNPAPTPFYQYILNHSYPQPEDAITKAKYLFKSCMNEKLIKTRGISPLLHLLRELGGWPVLEEDWDRSLFDFEWLLGQLRLYNNDIIISEWVGPDIRNSEEYVIQIDQSTLGLPSRDYFLDKTNRKYVDAYKRFIETVAVLLGADEEQASDDAVEMVEFEIELAAITVSAEHRKNVSDIYVRLKLKELHSIIPQIDWFKYIRIITRKKALPNDPIVTFSLNYLHRLVGLLSSSNPRTVCNYLLWRFIRHRVNNLDDRFQDAKQRFYKVLFGREQSPQRWQSCISQVNSNLGMALGSLFVRKYFDERSKNDTLDMTVRLRESFKELLLETDWLDVDTKKSAALKIDYMRLKIGYPNYILDDSQLDKRYRDVQIHPSFYFENTLSILQHLTRLEHSKLSYQVDKNFWNSPPAVVNAYYSRNKNQIMFPAGILQPPFYHRNFPRSLNYGGIGVVIGHEMTHGFDDKGRLFDKDGNLKVWWKKESIEEFHERSKCLIEQYNSYIVPEANMQMDGSNTQGENIADNGGIKQAFRAYKHFLLRNPKEENLPGLNLTNMQLFFLNFAQIWCGTTRPEAARNKLRTAVHSPGRFRVIGTLSNSEEFSKVYQCPTGSLMNPKVKCKIW